MFQYDINVCMINIAICSDKFKHGSIRNKSKRPSKMPSRYLLRQVFARPKRKNWHGAATATISPAIASLLVFLSSLLILLPALCRSVVNIRISINDQSKDYFHNYYCTDNNKNRHKFLIRLRPCSDNITCLAVYENSVFLSMIIK